MAILWQILLNQRFPDKSYLEKSEQLQKIIEEEKSIYVSDMCYELFAVSYGVFLKWLGKEKNF